MGILDSIKEKAEQLDKTYNPFRIASDKINEANKKLASTPGFGQQDPQASYEAKEKAMNRTNQFYQVDDSVRQVNPFNFPAFPLKKV